MSDRDVQEDEMAIPPKPYVSDEPNVIAGAIQYVNCAFCGAVAGDRCNNRPWFGFNFYGGRLGARLPENFAHYARRAEYVQWRDVFGPAKKSSTDISDLLGP